jgi:hypothetical protein
VLVTAVASPSQNPSAVATSPTTTHQTNQFKDVYRKSQDDSNDKNSDSQDSGVKKNQKQTADGKSTTHVIAATTGTETPKVPFLFSLPSLGLAASDPTPEENSSDTEPKNAEAGSAPEVKPATPPVMTPNLGTVAFSVHLMDPSPSRKQTDAPAIQPKIAAPTVKAPSKEAHVPAVKAAAAATDKQPDPTETLRKPANPEPAPAHEFVTAAPIESHSGGSQTESIETSRVVTPAPAIQDVQPIAPQSAKTAPATELLLHLGGKDQSSAAIRVMDRAGAVNVSVHTTDPELRTSLRSNLSDLSSQLNDQGIRAEVVKPAIAASNMEHAQQDSRQDQDRPSGQQQQFSQGHREQQQNRRGNPARWQDEFELEQRGQK